MTEPVKWWSRDVPRVELVELLVISTAMLVLTPAATWAAGMVGVPFGWRLAAGACVAVLIVGAGRLAYRRERPTLKWFGALLLLWGWIALANVAADVRFW